MDVLNLREPVSAWSHGLWLLLTPPAALLLWSRAAGDRGRQVVLLGYTLCLASCASASTLYHGVRTPDGRLSTYLLLDYIGIYLLIAGTYTPIAWTLMRGRWRRNTLVGVWGAAAVGIGLHLLVEDLPGWLGATLYLAMGWGSLLCYFELARTLSHRTLSPIFAGGVLYSVGTIFHVLRWPVLWPGVVGGHEVFHVFVVAASATHFGFMLKVVAPWDYRAGGGRGGPDLAPARAVVAEPGEPIATDASRARKRIPPPATAGYTGLGPAPGRAV